MIKTQEKGNTVSLILSGKLENFHNQAIHPAALKEKKVHLIGENIESWTSDFVIQLYKILKHIPTQDIAFSNIPSDMEELLHLVFQAPSAPKEHAPQKECFLERLGGRFFAFISCAKRGLQFIHQTLSSWNRQLHGKAVYRTKDFWLALSDCGPKAILIVSLISFMVGLILAFVGALQLKTFGAQIYVASLVCIGMTRIMGAIMTGIIMAGRTGASYAATIGTMQVNEELDALKTMGISWTDFLVLPRMNALSLSMPVLVLLSDLAGILGGCFVCVLFWNISLFEYIRYTISAFDITTFLVGVFHGVVFAYVIAICGCYFGIHCGRNADSVGIATTKSVVYAIVWMIVMTGFITLACEGLGI